MNPVQQGHAVIDQHVAAASAKSAESGRPITCRGAKCYGCCSEPVMAERREIQHIVDQLPMVDLLRVRERTQRWWDSFVAHNFLEAKEPPPLPDGSTDFRYILEYRSAKLWCPLLENLQCMAYTDRLSACRLHLAVGDPQQCHVDSERPRQIYMTADTQGEAMMTSMLPVVEAESTESTRFEYDHVGVWLAGILLGNRQHSRAASGMEIVTQQTSNET